MSRPGEDLPLWELELPDMPVFDRTRCSVRTVNHLTVQRVLAQEHYMGKPGATHLSLGLYVDRRILGGVITFGRVPGRNAAAICGPDHADQVLELTRLAVYEWMPTNSASWLMGQAFKWLEANWPEVAVLVSYADPYVGHCGTVYQATNWLYTGVSHDPGEYVTTDGTVWHHRTITQLKGPMPEGQWQKANVKYRYVTFLGGPAQRRRLRAALLWETKPYPKGA
jgi:hypothetical protein